MAADSTVEVRPDVVTATYFDENIPEYGVARHEFAADFIRTHAGPDASLVDLGCGVGDTLAYMKEATGIANVAGLDVSPRCLEQTRERVGCETFQGSIYDPAFASTIDRRFDFGILAAVLHHLIGRSRKESRQYAELALRNSVEMLKPGGHLIVLEPIFSPPRVLDGLFYVKKAMSKVSSKRIGVGGYWNNIGVPVVSYYTNEQLAEMVGGTPGLSIVARDIDPESLGSVVDRIVHKTNTTLIARKDG
jgi:SAM-dependent methyltransferase